MQMHPISGLARSVDTFKWSAEFYNRPRYLHEKFQRATERYFDY